MESFTVIALGISLISTVIAVATLWFRFSSKIESGAKDSVSKIDLRELEEKVSKIKIEVGIITERLSNTIEQSNQISNKLDKIMYQILKKDKE